MEIQSGLCILKSTGQGEFLQQLGLLAGTFNQPCFCWLVLSLLPPVTRAYRKFQAQTLVQRVARTGRESHTEMTDTETGKARTAQLIGCPGEHNLTSTLRHDKLEQSSINVKRIYQHLYFKLLATLHFIFDYILTKINKYDLSFISLRFPCLFWSECNMMIRLLSCRNVSCRPIIVKQLSNIITGHQRFEH